MFAGARALYRAAGVDSKDFGKPIVAIANSFDEFVPGHVHLNKVGRLVSEAVKKAGGDPDHFPTTWPEVAELAKKIKESGACKYGLTSGWQSWVQLESFSAWHNVPFATNNNGYDGLDTKLLFNSPLHVKQVL